MPPPPPTGGMASSAGMPQNYMVASIIGTILGFCTSCIGVITGIIAIIYGNKVKTLWAAGDAAGAAQAANTAKIFMIITWVIIAVAVVVNIILVATGNFYYNFSTN